MISPIITNLSTNGYSINRTNKNIIHRNNIMNNVSFGNGKQQAALAADTVMQQINFDALWQHSHNLINDLKTFCVKETELKAKARGILDIAQQQINDILKEYGFNPKIFNPIHIGDKQSQIDIFFKLMKEYGGSEKKVKRGSTHRSYFEQFALDSMGGDPDTIYNNTYQILRLTSKKYPNTQLEVYCTPNRRWFEQHATHKEKYLLGISSLKTDSFNAADENLNKYNKNTNNLRFKNPELEFTGSFCLNDLDEGDSLLYLNFHKVDPLIDQEKKLRFEYDFYKLKKIISQDNNTTFDLSAKTITQKFPDKNVLAVYYLSEDLEHLDTITLKKMDT